MRLKTVKIKADNESGYILINESDLKDGQVIYEEQAGEIKNPQIKKTVRRKSNREL